MSKAYSAPGKALLAGGYLVLDPKYSSYVTALSSRMHVVIKEVPSSEPSNISTIKVLSSQFLGHWEYRYINGTLVEAQNRKNPFIEATISTVLKYIIEPELDRFNLEIRVFSDPGYHTKAETTVKSSTNGNREFLYHGNPIEKVAKTGLGSSAGLVSALTGALLAHFRPQKTLDELRDHIHNTAQIAHCFAQKKVGSGFDVATAIYGSIEYQRFSPQVLDELFASDFLSPNSDKGPLQTLIECDWKFRAKPISLPPKVRLLMGDIKGGSNTPNLVSKVLAWKKNDPVASDKLYHELNAANMLLIKALESIGEYYERDSASYLNCLSKGDVTKAQHFADLTTSLSAIRSQLQKLTKYSGADVEPKSQTELLDVCSSLDGVFGGVVPGAGGFDAVCLVVAEDYIDSVINNKHEALQLVSWLYLKEESQGIVEEKVIDYEGLP